jgi:epoxyqueuosine reductase
MLTLEARLTQQAHTLGFELAGIARASEADCFDRFQEWLDQGFAGEMSYLERHAEARRHPASILTNVRSVLMVGMNYNPTPASSTRGDGGERQDPPAPLPAGGGGVGCGRIARYAQGADYHDVLRARLNQLLAWVQREVPGCCGRGVVDTAPLLERDFARRAGLGWFGKNTMLLNKRLGSFFFLGALLLDLDLQPDPPHDASHCGTCTACLDVCPTQAFVGPYQLDARRCISYLTIELKGPVPSQLREGIGDWLFGCDICQDVCPWNRKAPAGTAPELKPRQDLVGVDPIEVLGLSDKEFRHRFRTTALMRAKRRGLLRNAALVLGNRGDPAALPALRRSLADPEPLVREAAEWAIERITRSSMGGSDGGAASSRQLGDSVAADRAGAGGDGPGPAADRGEPPGGGID